MSETNTAKKSTKKVEADQKVTTVIGGETPTQPVTGTELNIVNFKTLLNKLNKKYGTALSKDCALYENIDLANPRFAYIDLIDRLHRIRRVSFGMSYRMEAECYDIHFGPSREQLKQADWCESFGNRIRHLSLGFESYYYNARDSESDTREVYQCTYGSLNTTQRLVKPNLTIKSTQYCNEFTLRFIDRLPSLYLDKFIITDRRGDVIVDESEEWWEIRLVRLMHVVEIISLLHNSLQIEK